MKGSSSTARSIRSTSNPPCRSAWVMTHPPTRRPARPGWVLAITTPSRGSSLLAWRGLEHDALQLVGRPATEAHGGLDPLGAEVAGVKPRAQVVERGAVLVGHAAAAA